jgi:hypothetical protein
MQKQKKDECEKNGRLFMDWLRENRNKLAEFLPDEFMPRYPKYGDMLTGGCKGFGKNSMKI